MMELLSPAGSMEALQAAVQNGADAVYLGCGSFNARAGAKNFTEEQLREAVAYCHVRGAAVHLTVNTLTTDREEPRVAALIASGAEAGVDAFIVQDPGTVALCRRVAPSVAVHASTQMGVHNLDGVLQAAAMGCSRAVLARELSRENIAHICRHSPIEIEVFVHGALCMCYSGQCYFSSVVGRRSGNRGQCAQPCRLPYGYGQQAEGYPLSLRDNCLAEYLGELDAMGVASLKIEGRMKRPEYVAVVTGIYRAALTEGGVTGENARRLEAVFSRQGFTQGYYRGQTGAAMLGTRQELKTAPTLLSEARATYENKESPRVGVTLTAELRAGQPAVLTAEDDACRRCTVTGAVPEPARTRALTPEELTRRLNKTGGTPYFCREIHALPEPGLMLSAAGINDLRRRALEGLTALRGQAPKPPIHPYAPTPPTAGQTAPPVLTVSVLRAEQITDALLAARPAVLYVPLAELARRPALLETIPANTELCPVLPRVIPDSEGEALRERLLALGQSTVLCGNLGHVAMAKALGLEVRGDFGLNLFSSAAARYWSGEGLRSATVSFEATLPQIRDMSKPLPMELLIYGRLPLMITENCLIRNRTGQCACTGAPTRLTDRRGEAFPVLPDPGTCRSVVYNGKTLWLLDRRDTLQALGLWALRLSFTTEDAGETDRVLAQYASGGVMPEACTRGLYYRGVE